MTLEQLVSLYNNKYSKDKDLIVEDIEAYSSSGPLDRQTLLSLYKYRNDIYKEKKGKDNIKFKLLIERLKSYKDPLLIMHVLTVSGKPGMILTNVTFTEIIAQL